MNSSNPFDNAIQFIKMSKEQKFKLSRLVNVVGTYEHELKHTIINPCFELLPESIDTCSDENKLDKFINGLAELDLYARWNKICDRFCKYENDRYWPNLENHGSVKKPKYDIFWRYSLSEKGYDNLIIFSIETVVKLYAIIRYIYTCVTETIEAKTEEQTPEAKTEEQTPEAKTEEQTPEAKTEEQTPEAKTEEQTPEAKTEDAEKEAKEEKVVEKYTNGLKVLIAIHSRMGLKKNDWPAHAQSFNDKLCEMNRHRNYLIKSQFDKTSILEQNKSIQKYVNEINIAKDNITILNTDEKCSDESNNAGGTKRTRNTLRLSKTKYSRNKKTRNKKTRNKKTRNKKTRNKKTVRARRRS